MITWWSRLTSGRRGFLNNGRTCGPRAGRRLVANLSHSGGQYEWTYGDEGDPCDVWVFEDKVFPNKRNIAVVGFDRDDMTLSPITYDEMRDGCYDSKARLADMDVNHVDKSLSFPTFPRYCGQTFTEIDDRDLGLACVQAYNDWMIEEWCGDSDGRLIPLNIIPLWDVELAAAEVRRNAARREPRSVLQRDPSAPRIAEHLHRRVGRVLHCV